MICVLTGGTGGAKFVDGLRQVMPAEEITLIVNTGDDLLWWGLYVSPDIDSITYVLSGMLSRERGWGVKGDTFLCLQAMGQLGEPTWFHTGDRDLAVHLLRSRLMAEGKTLSEATATICDKLGVKARILPMSNSRVDTRVDTPSGELSFEEYFVQRWYQDPVQSVRFAGAAEALRGSGLRVQCTQTMMRTAEDKAALARIVLSFTRSGMGSADESASDKSSVRA